MSTITPISPLAAQVPAEVKETFEQKAEIDIEDAYHYLLREIHKIFGGNKPAPVLTPTPKAA